MNHAVRKTFIKKKRGHPSVCQTDEPLKELPPVQYSFVLGISQLRQPFYHHDAVKASRRIVALTSIKICYVMTHPLVKDVFMSFTTFI